MGPMPEVISPNTQFSTKFTKWAWAKWNFVINVVVVSPIFLPLLLLAILVAYFRAKFHAHAYLKSVLRKKRHTEIMNRIG